MSIDLSRQSFSYVALQTLAVLLLFCTWGSLGVLLSITLLVSAFVLVRIVAKNLILSSRSYTPVLFYVLISLSVVTPSIEAVLASLFLALSAWYVSFAFRREYSFDNFFRSGFFLGISALFAFESVFLLPSLVFGLWLSKRTLRESIVAVVGFLLPLLTFAYLRWGIYDEEFLLYFKQGFESVGWGGCQCVNLYADGFMPLVSLIFSGVIFALSVFYIRRFWAQTRFGALRLCMFFVVQAVSCFVMFAFTSSANIYSLMAVPMSILMPNLLIRGNKILGFVLYALLLVSVCLGHLL